MKEKFKIITHDLTIIEVEGERITIAGRECFVTEELLDDRVYCTIHHLHSAFKISMGYSFSAAYTRAEKILNRETQEISTRAFDAYTQVMALNK